MSLVSRVLDRVAGGRMTKSDFERRFDRYLSTGTREAGDGEALLKAFLASGGGWLTDASRHVAARGRRYDFGQAEDVLGLWNQPGSFDTALSQLNADGYAILDVTIPMPIVDELASYFAEAPCTLTSDMGSPLAPGATVPVDFENPLAEKYAVVTDDVLQSPTVRRLLLDRGLLQIAQAYCGSVPIIDIIIAWFSFPKPHASIEAGQLYHFDLDRIRWLKAFLLLTDQDAETGAHMYIPGTQRDHGISKDLLTKGYARLPDDEVARHYPQDTWKTMSAAKGVILLEDTRGLHKGLPLIRDHRLMLQFEYAHSMFGHPSGLSQTHISPIEDPYWAEMNAAYPELFGELRR